MVFVACRLITLDKKPGVRPIGIGDVSRRIIAKTMLIVIRMDIHLAAGALQICAGHDTGAEATIHAMRAIFAHENTYWLMPVISSTNLIAMVLCTTSQFRVHYLLLFKEHLWDAY